LGLKSIKIPRENSDFQGLPVSSVKMLATVRKMALPVMVEITGEVSVAGTITAEFKSPFGNRFEMLASKN